MTIPLDLFAEVTTASGTRFKWDANQPPDSRLKNFRFATKIGEGFSDASGQLARRIDQDYPDLNLVDTVTFTGADGSVAYEGRVSSMPRDLSDSHSIGVTLAGWMAHAKDRKFAEIYIDRDIGQWGGGIPIERQVADYVAGVSLSELSFTADQGGLACALPNQALGATVGTEAWYQAPPGCLIAQVTFQGAKSVPAGWVVRLVGTDDRSSATEVTTPTLDNTIRALAFSNRRYVFAQVYANGSAATPAAGANARFSKLAVYGNHGLTLYQGDAAEPSGVLASDVITDIAHRFCPKLDTSGVQATSYVIQHLAFRDQTFPFDAFLEVNKYHLWRLAVWEDKRLDFGPYDLSDYDWEIRTDDPGTTFAPQGPSTESLFNGIAVTYKDPLTGVANTITPDTNPELADTTYSNPWNLAGVNHWDDITLSSPALTATAAQIGIAALADRNRPKTPGTITVHGYIRDRQGNEQPVWKVRAGDTISVTNFPNDSPRLIVETDYDDETKTISLAIDKPFALIDAYLDRQANALQAAGLA
jgi:hypothetical protein